MYGAWPQLSFPICSHISRASPPIVMNQSPFFRIGMYLIGSQKSRRRLELPPRLKSSPGFLGPDQIHSNSKEWRLVHDNGRRSPGDVGANWKRQLGPSSVHERLSQRTLHALL